MRYELGDYEWSVIKPILPNKSRGVQRVNDRVAVQMIDIAVVRVHQHGACIADNNHQDMGRSRGGPTSKIHAVVDTNGLPVHLALTPGEAHDNRLCSVLLCALLPQTILLADRGYDADWIRETCPSAGSMGEYSAEAKSQRPDLLQPPSVSRAQHPSEFGSVLMSPRPGRGDVAIEQRPQRPGCQPAAAAKRAKNCSS
jgi:transposase